MSEFELRINVYNSSKVGHANVSFYESDQHVYTIGANIRLQAPLLAVPKIIPFEPDDGIYQDETAFHAQAIETGIVTSAAVPITDSQYTELINSAKALEGQTFNYSVFTEACIELVEEFYGATGHPGEFGDLFPEDERSGSLVWTRVPVSEDPRLEDLPQSQPLYVPLEPVISELPLQPTPETVVPPTDIPSTAPRDVEPNLADPLIPEDTREPTLLDDTMDRPSPIAFPPSQRDTKPDPIHTHTDMPQTLLQFDDEFTLAEGYAVEPTDEHDALHSMAFDDISHAPRDFETATHTTDVDPSAQKGPHVTNEQIAFDGSVDVFEFNAAEPKDAFDDVLSEPAVDLSYGDQFDGSHLMEPLSVPSQDLQYPPEMSLPHEFERTGYDQIYDDFGTFI